MITIWEVKLSHPRKAHLVALQPLSTSARHAVSEYQGMIYLSVASEGAPVLTHPVQTQIHSPVPKICVPIHLGDVEKEPQVKEKICKVKTSKSKFMRFILSALWRAVSCSRKSKHPREGEDFDLLLEKLKCRTPISAFIFQIIGEKQLSAFCSLLGCGFFYQIFL